MANSNYSCSQSELYTTCRNGWLYCQQYLSEFADYKGKYTPQFIAENFALINTVESMSDFDARTAPVKDLRKDLLDEKSMISVFYKHLKGYVIEAYKGDKTVLDAMYTEMGEAYYEKMNAKSWTDVSGLISAMVSFVKKYSVVLKEKGYMPDSFLTRLEETQASFKAAHESWQTEFKAAPDATESKILANNDLKSRLMSMLADGQAVFSENKALAQKFVWTTILASVRGTKPTGLSGQVLDKVTEAPLSMATITIETLNKSVTCDKNGRFQLLLPNANKQTIVVKAEGYQTLVIADRDIKAGVIGRLNVGLVAE